MPTIERFISALDYSTERRGQMAPFAQLPPEDERAGAAENLRNIRDALSKGADMIERASTLEEFVEGMRTVHSVAEYFFNGILLSMAAEGQARGATGMVLEIGPDVDGPAVGGGIDVKQMLSDLFGPQRRQRPDPGSLN